MLNRLLFIPLSLVALALGAGCADQFDTGSELGIEQGANTLCPAVYEPVCGKDGLDYSNTCEAGGKQNVAYPGECNFLCAAITCLEGSECYQINRTRADCFEIQTGGCAVVRCASGRCVDLGGGGAICVGN